MPELPEVETVRASLERKLVGRRFEEVEILDSRLTRPVDPAEVAAELEGERVSAIDRRGKYLIVRFESGLVLLIHLRMTGNLVHSRNGALAQAHLRAVVRLDDGSDVIYRDVRRFGTWLVLAADEVDTYLAARLGLEPLERTFSARNLGERLVGRRVSIKAALLDRRPAGELDRGELGKLHRGIRRALEAGIARQGATLRDYRTPEGAAGTMQDEFKVYGRGGEPCPRCGTPIAKTRIAGRGTWFCPGCQR